MQEERKLVTIFFADVTGSTALGETLDPEDVRALMSRYYDHAREVISSHGGTLEKFIGDAVMAVFGLPYAHEDDAERALAAALALCQAVEQDNVLGEDFQLRIGVNTGEVIATSDVSRGDFLVTGDAVNTAARLQQHAAPGEIVASERTRGATRRNFLFKEARQIEVKGKRQPLRIFPLASRRLTPLDESPPFMGRTYDLQQLDLLWRRVQEERRPQIVCLLAPAGLGKTRLIEEFLKRLSPTTQCHVTIQHNQPFGQTMGSSRALLNGLLGEETKRAQLIQAFRDNSHRERDAIQLTDTILASLGLENAGKVDQEGSFIAWRLLIESLAQHVPHIIVIEDLHWATDSQLDFIERTIDMRIQAPVLLITTTRAELFDRRPQWGGGRPNFLSLALPPLPDAHIGELARHLLPDAAEAACAQIITRSAGNPFFALELIRGLSEHTPADISAITLPDTIHAAILARCDLLATRERRILQTASVATRTFRAEMLQAVQAEYSQPEIEAALDELLLRGLLVLDEGAAFAFSHVTIRDVIYSTLSRAERIRLHACIATWLESQTDQPANLQAESIAYHYLEAVKLSRQSAIALKLPVPEETILSALKRAGRLASNAGAFAEAQNYLKGAVDIASAPAQIELLEFLGDCAGWGSVAVDAYAKALELWRQTGETTQADPLTGARLLRKLLIQLTRGGSSLEYSQEELLAISQKMKELAEVANDEDELWHSRVAKIFLVSHTPQTDPGRWEELRDVGLQAAEYFERKQSWSDFSEALDGYASLSLRLGKYQAVLEASQRRLAAPELTAMERGDAVHMVATASMLDGHYDLGIATLEEELARIGPGQSLLHLGSGIADALIVAYISGHWNDNGKLQAALETWHYQAQHDKTLLRFAISGYLALLMIALAREDQASIERMSAILSRISLPHGFALSTFLTMLQTDSPPTADIPFGEDIILHRFLFIERGWPIPKALLRPKNLLGVGELDTISLALAQALADENMEQFAKAIDEAESHNLPVLAARSRIVLAQRTGDSKQLARARPILEQLQDRQYLRRLEAVAAKLPVSPTE
ncbi:adenylate/guanylate cyclase domain-containing protein [Ktedonosporobacter rubrisoli]|uniref:Adenylate/guanylate cyclase domain-containing protein n=1 Tax=Ktedonosporobacter rubrisoli TaxID=2509675 RepID=A0A4V0YZX4_KTERU|nr:adenylate/guanylate cyclase domain-containing protein [Ktedonosporobacter rubrisoli]QBD81231.1 adenylate/guanylate cyclase domain-containing protein [Ktedonosporobacter rubrisoli]